jgi:hypothetical protein
MNPLAILRGFLEYKITQSFNRKSAKAGAGYYLYGCCTLKEYIDYEQRKLSWDN